MRRYDVLAGRTLQEFPRFRVVRRSDSWWMRSVFWVLHRVLRNAGYSEFATTIFSTVYVPDLRDTYTDRQKYDLLRHEKRHIRQAHHWPLGRWAWPVNHLLFALAYLLLPLPVLWTARAYFEREGYLQNLLV